jgi:hypothetical protein
MLPSFPSNMAGRSLTRPDYASWRESLFSALDARYFTQDWLDREVTSGRALFLGTDKAAIVARIDDHPTGARSIIGLCAAGELTEIADTLIPQAEAAGRARGCTSAFIDSREAWARILEPRGYTPYKACVRKEL